MKKDSLGDRMKDNYETRSRTYLTRRTPVILRLDGKAFHTFTRYCDKPFDNELADAMTKTADVLLRHIQGAKLAYTQSDEISLLLTDYDDLNTQAWFDYQVQKICSVAASIASVTFTLAFADEETHLCDVDHAYFDCRAFSLPISEVNNYFVWRQNDWQRNSVQMLAQSTYSHKEIQGLSCDKLKEMLLDEKKINWNLLPDRWKNGTVLFKGCYSPHKGIVFKNTPSAINDLVCL